MTTPKFYHSSFDAQAQHIALHKDLNRRRAYTQAYREFLKNLAAQRQIKLSTGNNPHA